MKSIEVNILLIIIVILVCVLISKADNSNYLTYRKQEIAKCESQGGSYNSNRNSSDQCWKDGKLQYFVKDYIS